MKTYPGLAYPGLTASQKRNLAALIAGGLLTLNEHWPQVVAVVGLHYHGLPIPPGVTLVLQIAALGVTSLSRALNRAKSGTGTGIVGSPVVDSPTADTPADAPVQAAPTDVSGFVAALSAALLAAAAPKPAPVIPPPPRPVNVTITADSPMDADVLAATHAAIDAQAAQVAEAAAAQAAVMASSVPVAPLYPSSAPIDPTAASASPNLIGILPDDAVPQQGESN